MKGTIGVWEGEEWSLPCSAPLTHILSQLCDIWYQGSIPVSLLAMLCLLEAARTWSRRRPAPRLPLGSVMLM